MISREKNTFIICIISYYFSMEQLEQLQTAVKDAKDEVTKEFQEKITERENEMEKEKQIMKDRLHEVLSNEANLLNRIKSLESDEGYGRAEVDKALAKVLSTIFLKIRFETRYEIQIKLKFEFGS